MKTLWLVPVTAAFLFSATLFADDTAKSPASCSGKEPGKCAAGAVSAAPGGCGGAAATASVAAKVCPKDGKPCQGPACGKCCAEGGGKCSAECAGKCCDKARTVSLCPDKALALAKQIRAESCPTKCDEILASALPAMKCEKARGKLVADLKARSCEKEASQMILAAFKETQPAAAKETKADAPACQKSGATETSVKGCDKEQGAKPCEKPTAQAPGKCCGSASVVKQGEPAK